MLRKHVGLNYSFTLSQHYLIDSARVGNETRYINHGTEEDGRANSVAKSVCCRRVVFQYIVTHFLIQLYSYTASPASHYMQVSRVEAVRDIDSKS